jgi:hypothetical protein
MTGALALYPLAGLLNAGGGGRLPPSSEQTSAATAERADRAIGARFRLDAPIECTAFGRKLAPAAAEAAHHRFGSGRGLVNPPPMTDHRAENDAQSHHWSLLRLH